MNVVLSVMVVVIDVGVSVLVLVSMNGIVNVLIRKLVFIVCSVLLFCLWKNFFVLNVLVVKLCDFCLIFVWWIFVVFCMVDFGCSCVLCVSDVSCVMLFVNVSM